MQRAYEMMVILSGELDESPAQAWVKQIADLIGQHGGTVVGQPDFWGKRRFAYEINHRWDGYYVVYNLLASGGAMNEVERALRIADDVVRHKLLRLPDAEAARRGLVPAGQA